MYNKNDMKALMDKWYAAVYAQSDYENCPIDSESFGSDPLVKFIGCDFDDDKTIMKYKLLKDMPLIIKTVNPDGTFVSEKSYLLKA